MLWLWILGILAALILLLCLTRVGVRAAMAGKALTVDARVGLLYIRVFPGKEKKKKKEKAAKEKPEKPEEKSRPKMALSDIRDGAETLWPPLKRALGRTRRGILVKPLSVSVTLGGQGDPAGTAKLYGWLQAAVWTGMPQLERLLDIRDPAVHVGVDFEAPETAAEGTAGISLRIGTLLAVAFGVGIPAVRWYLRYRKRAKTAERSEEAAA